MKNFIIRNKKELAVSCSFGVFVILAMFDFLNTEALTFVNSSFSFSLSNLGIIAVIKIISGALPLTNGIVDILDKIFNFFFVTNVLIDLQLILLMANKVFILKFSLLLCFS